MAKKDNVSSPREKYVSSHGIGEIVGDPTFLSALRLTDFRDCL